MDEKIAQNPEANRYRIQSITKAMKVLSAFDQDCFEMSIGEIAHRSGVPKSTVHRIVSSLAEWNIIETGPDGKCRLGLKLFQLGSLVLFKMDVRKEAIPFLKELSTRRETTAHLAIRDGNQAIYIEKIEQPNSFVQYSQVGKHLPLHCTGIGKVLVADLPEETIGRLMGQSFPRYTENTITNLADLLKHLRQVRKNGYAVDNEELISGVKCVAAPVFNYRGEVVAGVSLSTTSSLMDKTAIRKLTEELVRVGTQISMRLGFSNKTRNQKWLQNVFP
jgi:DNA-binding IclR family transcriptional regulator